ncbi:MAG: hypothetical protein FDX21_08105 [Chlorobium sp.]|nr:MAG: hypothetical protein FDX21_08105 [Chlorobium sp.]
MSEYFFSFQEFLKIVPGLLIFPISLYLGLQKIGTKVSAGISFGNNPISPLCIRYVDLRNMKDRTIVIYAIYVSITDNELLLELKKCNPPLILKGYQSIIAEIPPYSFLLLDGNKFELDKSMIENTTIYLELAHSTVKCNTLNYQNQNQKPINKKLSKYRILENVTNNFNGIIYDEHAVYAITYALQSRVKTAIIHDSGAFHGEWDFEIFQLPMKSMSSKEAIEDELRAMQFGDIVEWFKVYRLRKYS